MRSYANGARLGSWGTSLPTDPHAAEHVANHSPSILPEETSSLTSPSITLINAYYSPCSFVLVMTVETFWKGPNVIKIWSVNLVMVVLHGKLLCTTLPKPDISETTVRLWYQIPYRFSFYLNPLCVCSCNVLLHVRLFKKQCIVWCTHPYWQIWL